LYGHAVLVTYDLGRVPCYHLQLNANILLTFSPLCLGYINFGSVAYKLMTSFFEILYSVSRLQFDYTRR